jgi:uncharacterized membrane protein YjdF
MLKLKIEGKQSKQHDTQDQFYCAQLGSLTGCLQTKTTI